MKHAEVRKRYLDFMKKNGHDIVPSFGLVPDNDSSSLFTSAGMQPMLKYLLGTPYPGGTRVADSQMCFRAVDIDEVGDDRHTTFFEMLGNWSFGDYFKSEQLGWIFSFLTHELSIDPSKLYVTAFSGDKNNGLLKDTESVDIWKKLFESKGIKATDISLVSSEHASQAGMQGGRIFYYDARKNWWSISGVPDVMPTGEPGGPDSEIFYEFSEIQHNSSYGTNCHPNCDCGRYIEIGNSVFMTHIKKEDGSFAQLPKKNVDFGGGLERITMASEDAADIFETDVFSSIIDKLEDLSGKSYQGDYKKTFQVVADHLRASTFIIAQGISSSNKDRGYVLRRLIRRAILKMYRIGLDSPSWVSEIVRSIITNHIETYPDLGLKQADIVDEIEIESKKFYNTLRTGLKLFDKLESISGQDAFLLFTSHGFPIELTEELANEKGIPIAMEEFNRLFDKHRSLSKEGARDKFKQT